MLLMPRIHRRPIERLKSNRSIKVYASERSKPVEPQERPQFVDRRAVKERRRHNLPVKEDRRRQDRRNAHRALRPEIRSLLENAGNQNPATIQRGGVYIDEDV
ncbi:MAG: hypothetical protein VYA55_08385 [Pseudomonadota bacterium]|nr:hypothetical protein [Pseudomonadota bacterium]